MKQAKLIYDTNRQSINFLLIRKGYPATFDGLLDAVDELGDAFLVELYNDITSNFDEADGNFWTKFKNIFHSATGVADKTGKITGGLDFLLNPDKQTTSTTPTPEVVKPWQPNLIWWGAGAAALILILTLIYIFKK